MGTEPGAIIDISPRVWSGIGVWPGDTPMSREVLAAIADNENLELSTLHGTVHLGAHADAWNHIVGGSASAAEMPLDAYLGACQIVHVDIGRGELITPDHLPQLRAPRLLVATDTFPNPDDFTTDFASFHPATAHWLAHQGGRLLGIDTPSIDLFESKTLPTHHACVERELAILEGLMLGEARDGVYDLIALPLRIAGFDASPVRAVLRVV